MQPERPGHIAGMFAPSLVAVGDNDNALVAQVLGILGPPLTRAAPVAGCYEAEPSASFAILLTLKNEHVACPDDLWKIVENMPDSVEVPQPAAATVRLALLERFGVKAHYLKEHL